MGIAALMPSSSARRAVRPDASRAPSCGLLSTVRPRRLDYRPPGHFQTGGHQVDPKPFVWHKTAEQILERLAGYCAAINQGN